MATCLDVAAAEYPATSRGRAITPMEGKSLRPILEGRSRAGHDALFWEHEGNRAVRKGRWKLVSQHPGGWELYDMEADRTELRDLAAAHPEVVADLAAVYDRWADAVRRAALGRGEPACRPGRTPTGGAMMRVARAVRSLFLVGMLLLAGTAAAAPGRPNIVVILADDLGFSDVGCYGGEIRTPNLDRLAAAGLRFTQFYNAARCCPTRASLLTGLYPHQAGIGGMTFDQGQPGYRGTLVEGTVTIAEALHAAGYRTAMAGKWHLSVTPDGPRNAAWVSHRLDLGPFSDPSATPSRAASIGSTARSGAWSTTSIRSASSRGTNPSRRCPRGSTTPTRSRITPSASSTRPGATTGLCSSTSRTRRRTGRSRSPPRTSRGTRQCTGTAGTPSARLAIGGRWRRGSSGPAARPLGAIRPEARWETNPNREWDARAMAVHAAMVERMDRGIGRIVAALRERRMLDDTLILFLSDNGASPEVPREPGFDRPSHTRDGREVHYPAAKDILPGPETTFGAIGPMWANVANTPLRYWKAEVFEGGIATPLVAHWPSGLEARPGSVADQVGHVIDVMATCVELAGTSYPRTFRGRPTIPLEGKSLVPILRGRPRDGHEMLGWEHFGARAVRQGRWKLVARARPIGSLYDIDEDRTETRDLAREHPDEVRRLAALYETWAGRVHVVPKPKPR